MVPKGNDPGSFCVCTPAGCLDTKNGGIAEIGNRELENLTASESPVSVWTGRGIGE